MTDQKADLYRFYAYDSAFVNHDVTGSVLKFTVRAGVLPFPGGLSAEFAYPIADENGTAVTVAVGDILCPLYHGAYHNVYCSPMVAIVTSIERRGDRVHIEAESVYAPMLRTGFTATYAGSAMARTIFYAAHAAYNVVTWARYEQMGSEGSLQFRAVTGGTAYTVDQTVTDAVFDNTPISTLFQYLSELRATASVPGALSCAFPTYFYNQYSDKPDWKLTYTGYGNHRDAVTAANRVLTYDAGIIEPVEWRDSTFSILNDVTSSVKGGAFYQATDAVSIAAYGRRQSKLIRNIYTSQVSAQATSESLVAHLKDPKSRCIVTADYSYIFDDIDNTLNFVYTVTDDISGRSEEMVLRSFELDWPSNVCKCVFENAALPLEQYNLRLENRVVTLESAVPNQTLDTTSSPTFAGITLDNTIDGTLTALADGSLQLYNANGNFNFGPKNANYSYFVTDRAKFAMNKPLIFYNTNTHDIGDTTYNVRSLYLGTSILMGGSTFVDASRNITCGHVKPHAINTYDLGSITNYWNELYVNGAFMTSFRSMDQSTLDAVVQVAQSGTNNIWLRFRRGGASASAGALFSNYDANHYWVEALGADLSIKYGTTLVSGAATQIMKLGSAGLLTVPSISLAGGTTNSVLTSLDAGMLNVQTANGYLKMGPNNTTWCHFYTDLSKYYFNTGMDVAGNVDPYSTGNYDLGTSSKAWRALYLSTGLYMGGTQVLDASRNLSINDLTIGGTVTGYTPIVSGVTEFNAAASANTRNSHDATSSFLPGAVYVLRKKITFTNGLGPGTYRVYFEAAVPAGGGIVYARVYKNGVAVGTVRTTSSTTYAGWSQDFTGPLNPGDTIELWAYHSGDAGYYGYVRYFRVQYDLSLPTTMPATNT